MNDSISNTVPPIDGADAWWPFIVNVTPIIALVIGGLWGAYLKLRVNSLEEDKIKADKASAILEKEKHDNDLNVQKEKEQFIEKLKAETEKYSNKIKADTDLSLKEYEERSKQQTQDYSRWNEFQNDLIKETKELREECKLLREALRQAIDNVIDRDKQIKKLSDDLIERDKKIIEMTKEIVELRREVEEMQKELKSFELMNTKIQVTKLEVTHGEKE